VARVRPTAPAGFFWYGTPRLLLLLRERLTGDACLHLLPAVLPDVAGHEAEPTDVRSACVQGLLQARSNLNSTQQAQLAGAPQALSDIITVWS